MYSSPGSSSEVSRTESIDRILKATKAGATKALPVSLHHSFPNKNVLELRGVRACNLRKQASMMVLSVKYTTSRDCRRTQSEENVVD